LSEKERGERIRKGEKRSRISKKGIRSEEGK
jgi:hypothetical protein